jgi:hypothetical protein
MLANLTTVRIVIPSLLVQDTPTVAMPDGALDHTARQTASMMAEQSLVAPALPRRSQIALQIAL